MYTLGGVCMYATEMSIRRRDRVTERSSEQMKVPLKKNDGTHERSNMKANQQATKMDQKLAKIRSWTVLDAQSRFENAPACACDGSGSPKGRPRSDLRTPRACQQRQGTVQKDLWAGPQTLPNRPGVVSKQVWSSQRYRTRPGNDVL